MRVIDRPDHYGKTFSQLRLFDNGIALSIINDAWNGWEVGVGLGEDEKSWALLQNCPGYGFTHEIINGFLGERFAYIDDCGIMRLDSLEDADELSAALDAIPRNQLWQAIGDACKRQEMMHYEEPAPPSWDF